MEKAAAKAEAAVAKAAAAAAATEAESAEAGVEAEAAAEVGTDAAVVEVAEEVAAAAAAVGEVVIAEQRADVDTVAPGVVGKAEKDQLLKRPRTAVRSRQLRTLLRVTSPLGTMLRSMLWGPVNTPAVGQAGRLLILQQHGITHSLNIHLLLPTLATHQWALLVVIMHLKSLRTTLLSSNST